MERDLALIGFGEAGSTFCVAGRWAAPACAFDPDPSRKQAIEEAGLIAAPDACSALADARIVLSLVTADQALAAAQTGAAFLQPGALWIDMNSVAPDTKRRAADAIEERGGIYVDAAILAPVRPAALDVPVLTARDAPIATLDPRSLGNFAVPELPSLTLAEASLPATGPLGQAVPQVVEDVTPGVEMVAVRPSWVQVTSADGSVIYEGIMTAGDSFTVPLTEEAPKLRTGESGAIYFAVNGGHFGPVGARGQVSKNIDLSVDGVLERFELADLEDGKNSALATMVAELQAQPTSD